MSINQEITPQSASYICDLKLTQTFLLSHLLHGRLLCVSSGAVDGCMTWSSSQKGKHKDAVNM